MGAKALPRAGDGARQRALDVLLSGGLEPIVDMVAWVDEPGWCHVASAEGGLRFRRRPRSAGRGAGWVFEPESLWGRDPLARQDPSAFGSLAEERSMPHPHRADNAYPHAFDHLAQVFDHPSAPDLLVLHSAAHFWGDQGGHIGEHGSLGIVQARAPFVAAGAGIRPEGMVERSCRLVDVAPTVLELLGCRHGDADGAGPEPAGPDGAVLDDLLSGSGASHVVAMLLDGTNANVLYDMAERGLAPSVARLMDAGTTYRFGAIASLPTVTLANHTTVLTGRHPGHHGILHNAWVDRDTGAQVVTNSPTTWSTSMQWLHPGVETIHHAVHRTLPGAVSVSINEPCDPGADYSVFELMRAGAPIDRPPPADDLPDATQRFVRPSKDYRWSSLIDHTAVEQFVGIWGGEYRGRLWPTPAFTWVNFTLTDAAFHEGGPYSEIAAAGLRDTDARIGRMLEAVEQAGAWERTAFIVVADHGMQQADTEVTGDWDVALDDAGVAVRDEGYGFLYLL
ncbi:MAG TPA: alkaline phosphatase family protein [Acidimicrobiales bacterium]|nr:alkaline phosphatase family protein [Acidimicrobiales bacterium]